jgi:hypothetical protein
MKKTDFLPGKTLQYGSKKAKNTVLEQQNMVLRT